mmetsp:Transcript_17192/g.36981  ORF Transcript_17192/g.36981 Transcript_17192/m.36981 type:complete len:160 (-) Transcript_17192:634-1113(-)
MMMLGGTKDRIVGTADTGCTAAGCCGQAIPHADKNIGANIGNRGEPDLAAVPYCWEPQIYIPHGHIQSEPKAIEQPLIRRRVEEYAIFIKNSAIVPTPVRSTSATGPNFRSAQGTCAVAFEPPNNAPFVVQVSTDTRQSDSHILWQAIVCRRILQTDSI